MRGKFHVRIKNNRNSYTFVLSRNLTVLRGDSGRGKTTLFDMIHDYNRFAKESGVSLSCDKIIYALSGDNWEYEIRTHPNTIIVIDEDSQFVRSKDFAKIVRESDNYFLLITRNYLPMLPVSVDEIYELEGTHNKKFRKVYQQIDRIYDHPSARLLPFTPEIIITEDSKSGYQFFQKEAEKNGILCVSANGKTKIFEAVKRFPDRKIVVIADGAAFGAEIENLIEQQKLHPEMLALFLPESFEWVILKSGVVSGVESDEFDHPELYAESTLYMSWEQYFTKMLVDATRSTEYMKYTKEKLADYYLLKKQTDAIKAVMKGIKL